MILKIETSGPFTRHSSPNNLIDEKPIAIFEYRKFYQPLKKNFLVLAKMINKSKFLQTQTYRLRLYLPYFFIIVPLSYQYVKGKNPSTFVRSKSDLNPDLIDRIGREKTLYNMSVCLIQFGT